MSPLLRVDNLVVRYGDVTAVDGVSFAVRPGETYALVGESGCGKTATGLAILRLVEPGTIASGSVLLGGVELTELTEREMCSLRGSRIGMVFQEPAAALNPVMRVGPQVAEALRVHRKMPRREARDEAIRLLRTVALPDPERQVRAYPHELSGGMKQRVMLAIALSCSPALLIADEPTTALDVTIQAQILELLRRLKNDLGLTVLLITHDLGVVAENADRVGVMYAGRLVEEAPTAELFDSPAHPYTVGLIASMPRGPIEAAGTPGVRRLPTLPGQVPSPLSPPPGCRFHPRCARAFDPCGREEPRERTPSAERRVSCFLHDERFAGRGPA